MHQTDRVFFSVVAALVLATGIGCGTGSNAGKSRDTRTPGQYFKEQQVSTMTPNGKIMTDSVEERDGKIEYKTEDGKKWRVGYTKRFDNTYQYGTPAEVK